MQCRHLEKQNDIEVCTCTPSGEPLQPSSLEKEKFCKSEQYVSCPLYRAYSPSKAPNRIVSGIFSTVADR